jgi:hypothetical protein
MNSSIPRNIEIFNNITAFTLVKLYESFPNPINLDLESIYDEVAKDSETGDEAFEIYSNYISSTLLFLYKEKFIEYDPLSNNMMTKDPIYYSSVLTLKGFSLLGTIPASISN